MAFGVNPSGSPHAWKMGRTVQQIERTEETLDAVSCETEEARIAMKPRRKAVGLVFRQEDTKELFLYISSELEPPDERWVQVQLLPKPLP
jgi:hypothetical protein